MDDATPVTGRPWSGDALRGGRRVFDASSIDPDRGAFFTTDPLYAAAFGDVVHRFAIRLENPVVHTEEESGGTIEIDRRVLISQGRDGRAIVYDDGSFDVVAFHPHQIIDLGPVSSSVDGGSDGAPSIPLAEDVEIPAEMTRWDGTRPGPPEDWDRDWKVLHRGDDRPFPGSLNVESPSHWEWDPESPETDIVAYHAVGWQTR